MNMKQKTPGQVSTETLKLVDRAAKLGYLISYDVDKMQLYAPMGGFDTPESIRDFLDGVERNRRTRRT
jgi:hypothetical protein